jgi:hypothetical protein
MSFLLLSLSCSIYPDCPTDLPVADELGLPPDRELLVEDSLGTTLYRVWDCMEISWWTGAEPQKVVQIFEDHDACAGYDMKLPWSFISKASIEYAPLVNLSGFQAGKGR